MKKIGIIIFIVINLFLSCSGSNAVVEEFFDDPITQVDMSELLSRAHRIHSSGEKEMIIVLEKVIYRLKPNGRVILQVHQVTKILKDQKGGLGKSFIYFRSGYEQITKIEAYTLTKDNKRIDATEITTSTPFYNQFIRLDLYKDIKVKTISLPRVEKGSILNLRYQLVIEHSDLSGIIEGEFFLANRFPILKQKGVIIVPKGKKIWFKGIKTSLKPKKMTRKQEDYYVIEKDNSPVIKEEPFQPPFQEIVPKIIFSSLKNWKELNTKLYRTMISGIRSEDAVRQKALELTHGLSSNQKKIEALYNFVTSTRNIANATIPFGIGGYIPNSSATILKARYADSKDKAILLMSLLKSIGLDSKIALTNESYNLDPDIPSVKALNRILVAVPTAKSYRLLDPHSAIVRFGHLPSSNYGKRVLILDSKRPRLLKIAKLSSRKNQMVYDTRSTLSEKGVLKYTTKFKPTGSYEVSERANMIKILLKDRFRGLVDNYRTVYEVSSKIKLIDLISPNPFDIEKAFNYTVRFKVKDFISRNAKFIGVQLELHHRSLSAFPRNRRHDLDFTLPFRVISKHRMEFPKSWTVKSLPRAVKITSSMWNYFREFKKRKNSIWYTRTLELKVARINRKDYPRFKKFIDRVIQNDKLKVQFLPPDKD